MKFRRKQDRRRAAVSLDVVLAASGALAAMDASLRAQGYAVASGRLYPCRDGSYTARVVWRHRAGGLTMAGSAQGLVLR